MMELPLEFKEKLEKVTNKRARCVIDTILSKGFCSTEDLKDAGYQHAPRAARDVRELGIPLETFKVKDREGKSIGAYRFGDWDIHKEKNLLSKNLGRTMLSNKLKKSLIEQHGSICFLYNEEYPEQQLQVDHRIPYEILGEQDDNNISNFMLLCPSGNRAKSWACEHCRNWEDKDVQMCKNCYYANPEDYLHISGEQERRIDLVFKNEEIDIYLSIKEMAQKKKITVQEAFKEHFKK